MKDQVVEEFKEQTSQGQECPSRPQSGKRIEAQVRRKAYLRLRQEGLLGFLYLLTIAYLIKTVQA